MLGTKEPTGLAKNSWKALCMHVELVVGRFDPTSMDEEASCSALLLLRFSVQHPDAIAIAHICDCSWQAPLHYVGYSKYFKVKGSWYYGKVRSCSVKCQTFHFEKYFASRPFAYTS